MANITTDIFKALREQRLNESTKNDAVDTEFEKVNEETETPEELDNKETPEELDNEDTLEEEITEEFSVLFCPHCGPVSGMNESAVEECPICGEDELVEKVVRVVRDGKIVKKKVQTRKKLLSPAQKAALRKARKKAHTAAAQKQRAKSMKKARKLNDEDYIECPDCGFTGEPDDFDYEDDKMICPDCGAEIE